MENPSSPLDTLRQLKEMLDAGALTPTEFESLKQRLVFTPPTPPGTSDNPPAAPLPTTPPATEAPLEPLTLPEPVASAQPAPLPQDRPESVYVSAPDSYAPAFRVEPTSEEVQPLTSEEDALASSPERNSSLGLVLAIGAVLIFLAVVAYLGFTRPASEHISSTSQTAADSLATTVETGPQAAPLPATVAVPETVRIAPTNPAPVIRPRPATPVTDSLAPAANLPASDSAGNQ